MPAGPSGCDCADEHYPAQCHDEAFYAVPVEVMAKESAQASGGCSHRAERSKGENHVDRALDRALERGCSGRAVVEPLAVRSWRSGHPTADQPHGYGDESSESASSQPPSIHWNGQNRLAGW